MIDEGELRLAGMDITAIGLNHPGGALAYRVRGTTGDVVYATDHEFGDPDFDEPLGYAMRREVEGPDREKLFLSGTQDLPPGWQALVEEYYRSLSRKPSGANSPSSK